MSLTHFNILVVFLKSRHAQKKNLRLSAMNLSEGFSEYIRMIKRTTLKFYFLSCLILSPNFVI